MTIASAAPDDRGAIDALLDAAFGTDRRGRTAYRLREGARPVGGLTFVARNRAALAGSAQSWDIALRGEDGVCHPLWLLGPVAVDAAYRGRGIATALIAAVLAAVDAAAAPRGVSLIGDEPFYGRFGFTAARTGGWEMPGPVDPLRLLLRGGADLPLRGTVGPASPVERAG